jgi:hypothetical protein
MFGQGIAKGSTKDIDSLLVGESQNVNNFLRGDFGNYPRRLRQGTLTLSPNSASWEPFQRLNQQSIALGEKVLSVTSRPADEREPNIKKGGRAIGVLVVPRFFVVTCKTKSGEIDLVVPSVDEPLVAMFFRKKIA